MHLILNCKIFYKAVSAQRAQGDPCTLCTSLTSPCGQGTVLVSLGQQHTNQRHPGKVQSPCPLRNIWLPSLLQEAPEAGDACSCTGGTLVGLLTPAHVCYPFGTVREGPSAAGQQTAPALPQGSEGAAQAPSLPRSPRLHGECQGPALAPAEALAGAPTGPCGHPTQPHQPHTTHQACIPHLCQRIT